MRLFKQATNVRKEDDLQPLCFPPLPVPQKADSVVSHSVILEDNGIEIVKSVIKIQPQPGLFKYQYTLVKN